eukprot:TRINITY_DN28794_c0_g1_i1.p1 TRINITY_DN28794_c0_g1~~TRINITY_DN28794_c0_g1_i1.p1  ORF type:complete len:422 (+),score=104.36 TRINITY_DN28794_c0_g1_i1:58-1266(+)
MFVRMMPGDWICPKCKNQNFASRTSCKKCSAKKDAGFTSPAGPAVREGDWSCSVCTNHNFASRTTCRGCGATKGGVKPGDWACPQCNHHNFASRTSCRGCGVDKGGPAAPPAPADVKAAPPPNPAMRPGDWMCKKCSGHNFASRMQCRGCGAGREDVKPSSVPPPSQVMKQGDWACMKCGHHNFASRAQCRECGGGRFAEAGKLPDGWDLPMEGNLKVVALPDGEEKDAVVKAFVKTMEGVVVEKVERVQNKVLWKRFACEVELLGNKTCKDLFHGTRGTPPELIYNGQDGFDMRFCTSGLWGIASYFSTTAAYSNSYAYRTPSGSRQMFLATVLLGNVCDFKTTTKSDLRLPPEMPPVSTSSASTPAVLRYDSVSGITASTTVHMIYANSRAYPKYLITYK